MSSFLYFYVIQYIIAHYRVHHTHTYLLWFSINHFRYNLISAQLRYAPRYIAKVRCGTSFSTGRDVRRINKYCCDCRETGRLQKKFDAIRYHHEDVSTRPMALAKSSTCYVSKRVTHLRTSHSIFWTKPIAGAYSDAKW